MLSVGLLGSGVFGEDLESPAAPAHYPKPPLQVLDPKDGQIDVYVIPIEGPINQANLYILRRGLKEAIANDVDMVVLDMETPGGRVDICLKMMEMLDRFEGLTATYVNKEAISAGSFISAATDEIYFEPSGTIGASAVIQGTGEDVPETARLKMESYLRAKIRVISEKDPLRGKVVRAMLDKDYELKVGQTVIKPSGELLTLTAREALAEYGDPPRALLGDGIYATLEELLEARAGGDEIRIKQFKISYSEHIAKWMEGFAPALIGVGLLLLFLEFKTPGFGFFGIAGIVMIVVFFISQYIAGLAGNEVILFFLIGVLLLLVELLFFPGLLVLALPGLALMLGSLLWAMVDFWPKGTGELSVEMFIGPTVNLIFGGSIAVAGLLIIARLLKGSALEGAVVLSRGINSERGPADTLNPKQPEVGARGKALTPLHPGGRVEISGQRFEAHCRVGTIESGAPIRVVGQNDFNLIVEEVEVGCS